MVTMDDNQLCAEIKEVQSRLIATRAQWIEASIDLAALLCQAKAKHPSLQAFGEWLESNNIDIDRHDREALLNLGTNLTRMRETLTTTKRSSYRYIWGDVQLSLTKG